LRGLRDRRKNNARAGYELSIRRQQRCDGEIIDREIAKLGRFPCGSCQRDQHSQFRLVFTEWGEHNENR
jgi:hypothetical protein